MPDPNPNRLYFEVSDPYINAEGKLVLHFDICGEKFEREITGGKDKNGAYILKEPNG